MRCEVARESLSARIDGERESVPAARVDEHLAQCPGCERWYASARGMNFAAADLAPDLSTTILEASRTSQHPHGGHRRYEVGVSRVATALRGGSVACAVAVVVLCFGYLTGSAPLWYPVVQGVLAVCAVGLAGAAALDSRRVQPRGPPSNLPPSNLLLPLPPALFWTMTSPVPTSGASRTIRRRTCSTSPRCARVDTRARRQATPGADDGQAPICGVRISDGSRNAAAAGCWRRRTTTTAPWRRLRSAG